MIKYEGFGDLFTAPQQTRVCPVNVVGAMGKGLALEFKLRYPGLNRFYLDSLADPDLGLEGSETRNRNLLTVWEGNDDRILLFPTKTHWRLPSTVKQIDENLERLAKSCEALGITSLAFPQIGCGVGTGGLNYNKDVQPLLYKHFGSATTVPISVYFGPE